MKRQGGHNYDHEDQSVKRVADKLRENHVIIFS